MTPPRPTDLPLSGTVAIVGRPNVGKSTLVNRFLGRREAIVEEKPGVTRDRKTVEAEWGGRRFRVVDTGGWIPGDGPSLEAKVSRQSEKAMAEADVVLFVVDATVGVTDEDRGVAGVLHRIGRPVVMVANKVDSERRELDLWEFAALGFGDAVGVSALHGRGAGDLLDVVVASLPPLPAPDAAEGATTASAGADELDEHGRRVLAVAIVGRPNVGKSTLFNRLIGDERAVVHDMPGTTRDTVDTIVDTPVGRLRFVDTAGMRRRSRVDEGTEYYSVVRALDAIDRADVALLLVDVTEGVTHQDQRLAERVDAAGNPILILLNKWDLLADQEDRDRVQADIADRLGFLGYAPVLKISARSGLGVHKLYPALSETVDAYHRRIPTRQLNKVIQAAQAAHPAPDGKVLYATQGATDPPTFTLFTNRRLPPTYLRYLERKLREHFAFGPTPLKLRVRQRGQ